MVFKTGEMVTSRPETEIGKNAFELATGNFRNLNICQENEWRNLFNELVMTQVKPSMCSKRQGSLHSFKYHALFFISQFDIISFAHVPWHWGTINIKQHVLCKKKVLSVSDSSKKRFIHSTERGNTFVEKCALAYQLRNISTNKRKLRVKCS